MNNNIVKVLKVSFLVNVLLSIGKIIAGILGHSKALIVDGAHSFSDLVTDVIAIFGDSMARKPADEKHPYGHGKIEYIISIIMSFVIVILGLGIIYEINNSDIVVPNKLVIFVSLITIIVKMNLAKYILRKGNEYSNNILIASGVESNADTYSSIVVLISAIMMQFVNYNKYFMYADKLAGIILGLFIIRVGFKLLKENASTIIGERENNEDYLSSLRDIILEETDITEIKELVVLKNGPYFKLMGEFSMSDSLSLKDAHDKIDIIENRLREYDTKIKYISIHMCPNINVE